MNQNLEALRKAEQPYTFEEQHKLTHQLIGALSSYVDSKTWNEALKLIYTKQVPNAGNNTQGEAVR